MRVLVAMASLLAAAPSCTDLYSVSVHGLGVPLITAQEPVMTPDASGTHLQVSLPLAATNPNRFPLTLNGVDFDLAIDGVPAFSGTQGMATIDARSAGTVTLSGAVDLHRSALLDQLRGQAQAQYRITGTVHLATPAGLPLEVEFELGGTFAVPKLPAPPN